MSKKWNEATYEQRIMIASGTEAFSTTLDNTPAIDNGDGTVRIASTTHGYAAGSYVYLAGTTNYNGQFELQAVANDYFDINAAFVVESPSALAPVTITLVPLIEFQLESLELTLNTAPTTTGSFVVTTDMNVGDTYDTVILSRNLATYSVTDLVVSFKDDNLKYGKDDRIVFTYANTDGKIWGLTVKYRILRGV